VRILLFDLEILLADGCRIILHDGHILLESADK
jgi:hypothetical protein